MLQYLPVFGLIYASSGCGLLYAIVHTAFLSRIRLTQSDEYDFLLNGHRSDNKILVLTNTIARGASKFLWAEYAAMTVFIIAFSSILFSSLTFTSKESDKYWKGLFSVAAFILGAFTSIISGWIGMKIAVYANGRTTVSSIHSIRNGFRTAYSGGCVMGFCLTGLAILNLVSGILLFRLYFKDDISGLFEAIASFGLGGSCIALFGRVAGGIYTKAADVGADLVGKIDEGIPEDDPRNPGVIADCIGDNVGDIAGMGSDLFGSFAEASVAALIITATTTSLANDWNGLMFPIAISAAGVLSCLLTSPLAFLFSPEKNIERALKLQLVFPTIVNSGVFVGLVYWLLPEKVVITQGTWTTTAEHWQIIVTLLAGLWSGLKIAFIVEYYTSHSYKPVRELANSCKNGASTNIIYGLSLGFKSAIIPCCIIAATILIGYKFLGMYGVSLIALGILSTMSVGLSVDAFGPISDNAGGIAEMAGMNTFVRERTDILDAAGNTTAAIGKGYAIASAVFVGVTLYCAFISRLTKIDGKELDVSLLDPKVYFGLILGGILPFWFSALTVKSVGQAAGAMVEEIRRQFNNIEGLRDGTTDPDYDECVKIATNASLKEMILPGALVIGSPIICGILFGPETLAGLLPGALVTGALLALASSNAGGAWDNAKKYIEAGGLGLGHEKGSSTHAAAVVGDTVGDPLKDTSGPALNILIKLMAIISVVFAQMFSSNSPISGILFK